MSIALISFAKSGTGRRCMAAALLTLCAPARAQQKTVHFSTIDGCSIEAFYLSPSTGSYIFINTHGLGSDKNEWAPFQEKLTSGGLGYLSLDLRGHGASNKCSDKPVNYRTFSKADWNNSAADITAAAVWLRKKGIAPGRMIFCGASIGANLSLKAAAEGAVKPAAVIMLSPGLDYAGVRTEKHYLSPQPFRMLLTAAEDDDYSWQSSVYLAKAAAAKGLPAYSKAGKSGHGVSMLKDPAFTSDILDWSLRLKR